MPGAPTDKAQLFLNLDLEDVDTRDILGGTAGVYTTRSPGKPGPNEDSAAIVPYDGDAGVLIVADGLGGMPAGADASRAVVQTLVACLDEGRAAGLNLRDAILDGIEQANRSLLERAVGSAATLALVEISAGCVRPYHVGDAAILLTGQRGAVKVQTAAHSPVGYALQSGLLDETEAMSDDNRHLVSNIVGSADMRIEIGAQANLAPRDTLLVASDGLFDNLYIDEIVQMIRKGPLRPAAAALRNSAAERMSAVEPGQPCHPDDLTLLLFRPGQTRRDRQS